MAPPHACHHSCQFQWARLVPPQPIGTRDHVANDESVYLLMELSECKFIVSSLNPSSASWASTLGVLGSALENRCLCRAVGVTVFVDSTWVYFKKSLLSVWGVCPSLGFGCGAMLLEFFHIATCVIQLCLWVTVEGPSEAMLAHFMNALTCPTSLQLHLPSSCECAMCLNC